MVEDGDEEGQRHVEYLDPNARVCRIYQQGLHKQRERHQTELVVPFRQETIPQGRFSDQRFVLGMHQWCSLQSKSLVTYKRAPLMSRSIEALISMGF